MSGEPTSRPDDPDEKRVERYLAGDAEATMEVQGWILRALDARFALPDLDREDLCQIAHAKLIASLRAGRFRHGSTLETYVSRITDYTTIDFLRRRYREREGLPFVPREPHDTHDVVVRREARRKLHRAIHLSSEPCRELWRLLLLDELSYTEIAERLGVAPGTIKSRVFRCRKQLDEILERLGREDRSRTSQLTGRRSPKKEATHDLP